MVGQGGAGGADGLRGATLSGFTRFVGIDWSGAKGARHPGIVVASVGVGDAAPVIVPPPGASWSRTGVLGWLRALAATGERALIGMDFSFSAPFVARGAYLPGVDAPTNARAFWAYVDACSGEDEDLGAGGFVAAHRAHFWMGAADGAKADFLHWRVCEAAFIRGGGGQASTVFDCVGAAQVAKASFAGMRLLHRLGDAVAVWPFDPVPDTGPVLVEIYARAFLRRAGGRGGKLRDAGSLNTALAGLGSRAWVGCETLSDHATDAIVTAAGLRDAAGDAGLWAPAGLTPAVAASEGWTFGVG